MACQCGCGTTAVETTAERPLEAGSQCECGCGCECCTPARSERNVDEVRAELERQRADIDRRLRELQAAA